jgi:hypothetical protein
MATCLAAFLIALLMPVVPLPADNAPPLPSEEAPATLFASLEEEEIDIFVAGSWELSLSAGFALTWNSLSPVMQTTTIPEISSGFQFQQYPDLTISVWLKDRWFFDASILEGYELNSMVAGYQGKEGELVQEARLGNIDIGSIDSPFFPLPQAGIDSLGLWAYLTPEKSEHRFALRYDPAQLQTRRFRGMNEINEELFDLEGYLPGQVFVLPDADVSDLRLYLEDPDGPFTATPSGIRYRRASATEAEVDPVNGIVYLFAEPRGRVAVHYTKGVNTVGDPALGAAALPGFDGGFIDPAATPVDFDFWTTDPDYGDFSELQTSIDGNISLLLHRPGRWSPFLHRGIYRLSSPVGQNRSLFAALVGGKEGDGPSGAESLTVTTLAADTPSLSAMVMVLPSSVRFDGPRSFYRRFPFAQLMLEADADIYGPGVEDGTGPESQAPPWKLQVEQLSPVTNWYLEEGVLEGSVTLTRNGREEYRFLVDYQSGVVEPLFPVMESDLVTITYRSRSGGERGDLVVAGSNRFYPTDRLTIELDAGLRWNLSEGAYTTGGDQAPGIVAAGSSLDYRGEQLSARLEAGLSLRNPDTTGIFRLLGMNEAGIRAPVSVGRLYPAATDDANTTTRFAQADRGKLYYSDYSSTSALGGVSLQRYDWTVPKDQRYPYDGDDASADYGGSSYRIGPSVASTGSETDGDAMVLTYELEAAQWVGGRIPLSQSGRPLDLRESRRLDLLIKLPTGLTADEEIYLRLGDLIEDLDGDGNLDAESGPLAGGFSFNHGLISYPVGKSNGITDSEDLNGDGRLSWLDGEDTELVWESEDLASGHLTTSETGKWQRISIDLSPEARRKLKSVTALDVMIKNSSGGQRSGTILVADILFAGSGFSVQPDPAEVPEQTVIASEALEGRSGASIDGVTPLIEQFPEKAGLFSDGGPQRTALFTWDAAGTWSASTLTPAASLAFYRKLSFFMRSPAPVPTEVRVFLTDPEGRGVEARFVPVTSENWILYTIDLDGKSITSSAGALPGSPEITINRRDAVVSYFQLEVDAPDPGELWLDEVHLSDPLLSLDTRSGAGFSWSREGAWLSAGGTALLSDLALSAQGNWDASYRTAAGSGSDHRFSGYTEASTGILKARLSGDFAFTASDASFLPSWSTALSAPFFDRRAVIDQRYGENHSVEEIAYSHSIRLVLSPWKEGGEKKGILESSFSRPGIRVDQRWSMELALADRERRYPFALSTRFALSGSAEEDEDSIPERFSGSLHGLFLPGMDQVSRRASALSASWRFPVKESSFTLKSDNSTESSTPESDRLDASHSLIFSWELPLAERIKATLGAGHTMKAKTAAEDRSITPASGFHGFGRDAADFGAGIGAVYLPLVLDPLLLFNDGPFAGDTGPLLTGGYTPELKAALTRQPGSRLMDLLIPVKIEASRSRSWIYSYGEQSVTGKTSISWKGSAINLFGRLGRYPLFSWYRTEEFGSSAGIVMEDSGKSDGALLLFADLQLNEQRSFRTENDLSLSLTEEADLRELKEKLSLSLRSRNLDPPDIPLPASFRGTREPMLLHETGFSLLFTILPLQDEKSFGFSASHETSLEFSEKGRINAFLSALYRQNRFASGGEPIIYYTVGFEAGIGMKLTF